MHIISKFNRILYKKVFNNISNLCFDFKKKYADNKIYSFTFKIHKDEIFN